MELERTGPFFSTFPDELAKIYIAFLACEAAFNNSINNIIKGRSPPPHCSRVWGQRGERVSEKPPPSALRAAQN